MPPKRTTRPASPTVVIEGDAWERRDMLDGCALETRAATDKWPHIVGHAVPFGVETELYPGYREVIEPGTFDRAIREGQDVRGLFNHRPEYLLGRSTVAAGEGSLELWEDEVGLGYRVDPLRTRTVAEQVIAPIRAQVLTGSSLAMRVRKQREEQRADYVLRHIEDADLFDVGPQSYPQYPEAETQLRSLLGQRLPTDGVLDTLQAFGLTPAEIRSMLERDLGRLEAGHASQEPRTAQRGRQRRALELLEIETLEV